MAKDEAFCFLYRDNLEFLKALGCEIPFQPAAEKEIPEGADALILNGGYPELHAAALKANTANAAGGIQGGKGRHARDCGMRRFHVSA